jgi:hypothetical protein
MSASIANIFGRKNRPLSGAAADWEALLARIRERQYTETLPVLASWWLKTVYTAGHNRVWWGDLDRAIARTLRRESLDATATEAIRDIRQWVRTAIHKPPEARALIAPPYRPDLAPEQAVPYLTRVLNEWLPAEVAHSLTDSDEEGMPPIAVAKALERLLVRERFSPQSLELLLDASGHSPQFVYPVDAEILRDIVLALLGRTTAPEPTVLPATVLTARCAGALDRASLIDGELHVPLDNAEAREILHHDSVRIASVIVTMDGRWWQSERLLTGVSDAAIVYRPGGRLRIDFTAEHARLVVPWPDPHPDWPGDVHLPEQIALFGREWRGRTWEGAPDRTWLHLEFVQPLSVPEVEASDDARPRRLRSASAEMAWSEVELALASGDPAALDQLRREDLIPLAGALRRLIVARGREDLERALASVRYLHSAVAQSYGPIPWRVLPSAARNALQKRRDAFALLDDTFEPMTRRAA